MEGMSVEQPAPKIQTPEIMAAQPSPAEVLQQVAQHSELTPAELAKYMGPEAFRGKILKIDAENRIILIRYAHDEAHLIKEGQTSTREAMKKSAISPTSRNNGVVHTSAALNWGIISDWLHDSRYAIYGVFKIPVADFLNLAKEHKISVGFLEEAEVTLSGDIAEKYLTETHSASDLEPVHKLIESA